MRRKVQQYGRFGPHPLVSFGFIPLPCYFTCCFVELAPNSSKQGRSADWRCRKPEAVWRSQDAIFLSGIIRQVVISYHCLLFVLGLSSSVLRFCYCVLTRQLYCTDETGKLNRNIPQPFLL